MKRRKIERAKRPTKRIRVKRKAYKRKPRTIEVRRAPIKKAPKKAPSKRIRVKRLKAKRPPRIRLPKPKPQKRPRKKIEVKGRKLPPPGERKEKRTTRPQEWLVSFEYPRSGKQVDFIVVAYIADQALEFVMDELMKTREGAQVVEHFVPSTAPFNPPRYRNPTDVGEIEER
jgi:hypothetical protein